MQTVADESSRGQRFLRFPRLYGRRVDTIQTPCGFHVEESMCFSQTTQNDMHLSGSVRPIQRYVGVITRLRGVVSRESSFHANVAG